MTKESKKEAKRSVLNSPEPKPITPMETEVDEGSVASKEAADVTQGADTNNNNDQSGMNNNNTFNQTPRMGNTYVNQGFGGQPHYGMRLFGSPDTSRMMGYNYMPHIKEQKVQNFSGKKADWRTWKAKHLAIAASRGYKGILTGQIKACPNGCES